MDYITFLLRLGICFVLGSMIGLERQWRKRAVSLRTTALVCLGSFLFVAMSVLVKDIDQTRIAAQVVSGIGFLGAGVILRDGTHIRGLNTAATLWCSAAIGTLTALGLILEAVIGVLYILLSNLFLRFISRKMMKKTIGNDRINYILIIICDEEKEMIIKNMLIQKLKVHQNIIQNFTTNKLDEKIRMEVKLEMLNGSVDNIDNIVNRICIEPGVTSVEYNKLSNYALDDDDDYEVK